MGAETLKKIAGPAFVVATSEDIYTPPAAPIYTNIRQIHLVNQDFVSRTVALYVGATGAEVAGTEILPTKTLVAGEVYDMYFSPGLKLLSTEFLVGVASDATAIVITVMGGNGVV